MNLGHPLQRSILVAIEEVKASLSELRRRVEFHLDKIERVVNEVFDQLTEVDCDAVKNAKQQFLDENATEINHNQITELLQVTVQFNEKELKRQEKIKQILENLYKQTSHWKTIIDKSFNLTAQQLLQERLKFHQTRKFETLVLEGHYIVKQSTTTNHYAFASIGEALDLSQVQTIRFRILNQCGDLGVGLLDLDVMATKLFRPKVTELPNGAYILFQDRYVLHNDIPEKNWKTLAFPFATNDLIRITYDPDKKTIEWTKEQSELKFSYQFTRVDAKLAFCAVFKPEGCSVEII